MTLFESVVTNNFQSWSFNVNFNLQSIGFVNRPLEHIFLEFFFFFILRGLGNTIYFCFVLRHYQKSMVKLINILHKSATFYSKPVLLKSSTGDKHQCIWLRNENLDSSEDSVHTQSQCRQLSNKIGAKFKNDFCLPCIWLQEANQKSA